MQTRILLGTYVLTIAAVLILNSGCNGNGVDQSFGSVELPSTATPVLPGTSTGILDDKQYFYVGVDTTVGAIAHVRSVAGFSTPCAVNKSSTANEDVTCLIDVPEGDLYGKDLELKYNVPAEMCRYLVRTPYWFYNHEVGVGPSTIAATVVNTVNASGDITSSTYNCSFNGGAMDLNCDNNPEIISTLAPETQTYRCIYDNTEFELPNCCFGNYTITTTTTTGAAAPITTRTTGKWGGDYSKCIGGPGKTDWSLYTADKRPASEIVFAEKGINKKQIVTAPVNFNPTLGGRTSSIHVANSYGTTFGSGNHTHTGFVDLATTSTQPYFIAPIDDRSGTLIGAAQDSYEFQCLDTAFEIKHRIRIYVRDWDTYPDYLAYISSQGSVSIPDRGTVPEPGTNCAAIPAAGYSCNDSRDIDDLLNINLVEEGVLAGPGLTYNTTVPTFRNNYFPRIIYP